MQIGNVYQIDYPITQYGKIHNPGDVVEIMNYAYEGGSNDVIVCRYPSLEVFKISGPALMANGHKLSGTPVPQPQQSAPITAQNLYQDRHVQSLFPDISNALTYELGPYQTPVAEKCECGCASVGVSKHSDYCPLYKGIA